MFFETTYNLGDYVHAKAQAMYQADVTGSGNCDALKGILTANFSNVSFGCSGGVLNANFTIPGDFSDESHVKQLIDGAVQSAGFGLRQSLFRLITNPGGTSAFPFAGGGAGQQPGAAVDPGFLATAGDFWGKLVGGGFASFGEGLNAFSAGVSNVVGSAAGGSSMLILAAVGLGAFLLLKRR